MIELSTTGLPSGITAISLLPWFMGATRISRTTEHQKHQGRHAYETGVDGELLAVGFLEQRGYKVLSRRFRTHVGEIDIVARCGDLVVFVEVKTSTEHPHKLAQRITDTGVHRTRRAAIAWITNFPILQKGVRHYRFDAILVTFPQSNEEDLEQKNSRVVMDNENSPATEPTVHHITNAF